MTQSEIVRALNASAKLRQNRESVETPPSVKRLLMNRKLAFLVLKPNRAISANLDPPTLVAKRHRFHLSVLHVRHNAEISLRKVAR